MRYLLVILGLLFLSCTTTKTVEVPIETIKTEYINNIQYDSIYIKDSIDRYIMGDTIYIYKQNTIYKYKSKIDTLIKVDSIQVPVYIETIKEINVLHNYQKILIYLGLGFLLYIILTIIKKI